LKKFISNLETLSNITIVESDNTTSLTILCANNYQYKITMPHDIKEWFVDLSTTNSNEIIWSDWSDWYILGDVTKDNINEYYNKDISNFISKIMSADDFKVDISKKQLKAKINDSWELVELGTV